MDFYSLTTELPPKCSSQIFSYAGDAIEFLGLHGSGFFVNHADRLLFVTARHCLGRLNIDTLEVVKRLLISREFGNAGVISRENSVDFKAYHTLGSLEQKDEFVGDGDLDIAVLTVKRRSPGYDELMARSIAMPKNDFLLKIAIAHAARHQTAVPLLIEGYPSYGETNYVCHESATIHQQLVQLPAEFLGNGNYPHTKILTLLTHKELPMQGFSGGPVYFHPTIRGKKRFALLGMLTNGGNGVMEFITCSWLRKAIEVSLASQNSDVNADG